MKLTELIACAPWRAAVTYRDTRTTSKRLDSLQVFLAQRERSTKIWKKR